eukprot:5878720-Pyramimonas_sp.AAC.1
MGLVYVDGSRALEGAISDARVSSPSEGVISRPEDVMGRFPSNFHSDTAEMIAAAWIAQADWGRSPVVLRLDSMRTLGVLMATQSFEVGNSGLRFLRPLVQFSSSSCTLDGDNTRSHQGEGYNELADTIARLTGMGLVSRMEYMLFASLMFDSSALAWAWICEGGLRGSAVHHRI